MANFFDQFDDPSGAAPASGGNFFDQFDEKPQAAPERSGLFLNSTAGLNEAIYSTIGAPVDLPIGALNLGISGVNSLFGTEVPQIEASAARSIGRVADRYLGVPDPETVQANTTGEHIARAAGQGAGYMLAPELAVRGAAQAAGRQAGPIMGSLFGNSANTGALAGNMMAGAAAGAGGQAAGQMVPEPYRPLAELGGNILGGGLGAAAAGIPRMVGEGARLGMDYAAPLSARGQERMAGTMLRDATSSPGAAREALDGGASMLVPGSQPTTFQRTGDMGLGALERAMQTISPDQFMQRRADQNMARVGALGGIQPQGQPGAVISTLRQGLADIDRMTGEALTSATESARARTAALGGDGTPEGYGASLRQILGDAEQAARTQERALWRAVDPDNTLALDARGIVQEAQEISRRMPQAARAMEGEEQGIFSAASRFGGVMPFNEVTALRSRVSTAMRQELSQNGQTPVYARLTQLRGAIERTIEGAVEGKAAQEAEAVASGAIRQEDTMLAQWEAAFSASAERWLGDRARSIGASSAESAGAYGSARAPFVPPAHGGEGSFRGGFADSSSNQGISGAFGGSDLFPNFDAAAQERLTAASAATKQRAQTYGAGPVRDALRRSGQEGPYNLPAALVPSKFFRPGARGYEDMQALRTAVSDPAGAMQIRDYALSTLRRAAEEPDGTLNPSKVDAWRRRHADALRAVPEIDQLLASPMQAAEAMAQTAASRKQALDTYQSGIVGRLMGAQDPADVTRVIGGIFSERNPVASMRRLVGETRGNPDARDGLRKAVADHMAQRLISNTEAATSGQTLLKSDAFQTFIRQNDAVLREVFSPPEMETLRAIAADLQRSNRSLNAVRIPGQSNTAQDRMALSRMDNQPSMLARIMSSAGPGVGAAAVFGPWAGIAGAVGGAAVQHMRQAGLRKVDDILIDAMLNPERARLLLQKAGSPREAADIGRRLMDSYRRTSTLPAYEAAEDGEQRGRSLLPLMMPLAPSHGVAPGWRSSARDAIRQQIAGMLMGAQEAPPPRPIASRSVSSPMAEQIRQLLLGNGTRLMA